MSRSFLVVGPSFRFLSGISVYTCRLANALAANHKVGVLLLDRLIPAKLYPGGDRVGDNLTALDYDPSVRRFGQIDWFWFPRIIPAIWRLVRNRPDVMVLQWWTAAVLHTYLLLALVAKVLRIDVVIEFHEAQDTGEAEVPGVAAYARLCTPLLLRMADGALVHNEHDRELLRQTYGGKRIDRLELEVAPHGPYDHMSVAEQPVRDANDQVTRLLCFGLIRPYKGTEDAVLALDLMSAEDAADFHLTVVGETWENWDLPAEKIAVSKYRDRIDFVNRYVTDEEAANYFASADVLVLPYRRGSASGPLHIAMANGLHVVMYATGGLVDAVKDYAGVKLVDQDDVAAMSEALKQVRTNRAERFADPHSWDETTDAFDRLADAI
ncbi:MAG TPA: glycosyltransferase [Aeromicrobium sp.]|nr:glycosyltransferase [Aeromicrobium sp.]